MIIKFGSIVTDGRGKLGGHVYAKNRGGNYVRTGTVPNNPQTSAQMAVRASFGQFSSMWSALTESQRNAWAEQAREHPRTNSVGTEIILSGKAYFQSVNQNLSTIGEPMIEAPVEYDQPNSVLELSVTFDETGRLGIEGLADDDENPIVVLASPPVSAGTSYIKNRLRVLDIVSPSSGQFGVNEAVYNALFGLPPVGSKVFAAAYAVSSSGAASPRLEASEIKPEPAP